MRKDIYTNYLVKIKEVLEKDDFDAIDYALEFMYTSGVPEKVILEIDDILQEVTLYSEFKEKGYKDKALELIAEFEPVDPEKK